MECAGARESAPQGKRLERAGMPFLRAQSEISYAPVHNVYRTSVQSDSLRAAARVGGSVKSTHRANPCLGRKTYVSVA
jgi:hypothetical protein